MAPELRQLLMTLDSRFFFAIAYEVFSVQYLIDAQSLCRTSISLYPLTDFSLLVVHVSFSSHCWMLSEPKFLLITKKAEPLRLRRLSHVVYKIFKFCLPIRIGGFDHIKSKVTSSGTSSGLQITVLPF